MFKILAFVYFAFWLILFLVGLNLEKSFFLSSQLGFFSAILIAFVSFYSYKKKVLKKIQNKEFQIKDKEETSEEISLKSEKERLKKKKLKLKDMNLSTAFVPYRLIAYSVLVIGFIFLKKNGNLSIQGLLIGLSTMPLGALIYGIIRAKNEK